MRVFKSLFCLLLLTLVFRGAGYSQPHRYSNVLTAPPGLDAYFDYQEALKAARQAGKPLLIEFTGHTAINAIRIEKEIWPDSAVFPLLRRHYILLQAYADDRTRLPTPGPVVSKQTGRTLKTLGDKWLDFQFTRFGTDYQPYYAVLNPATGRRLIPSLLVDSLFVAPALGRWLRRGVAAMPTAR